MIWRRLLVPMTLMATILGLAVVILSIRQTGANARSPSTPMPPPVEAGISVSTNDFALPKATVSNPDETYRPAPSFTCEGTVPKTKDPALRQIAVSVATLWKEPGLSRSKDRPSLQNPADLRAWLAPMNTADKLWLVGKLETEVLLGTQVKPLEVRNDWAKAAVAEQGKPGSPDGYTGWSPRSQLSDSLTDYSACPVAMVIKPTAMLYELARDQDPAMEISFGTRLPVVLEEGPRWAVAVPQGIRWVDQTDVLREAGDRAAMQQESAVTGPQLVETARQFVGLPYLWAGTSGFGFDCSGFTYSLYRFYGIAIPRDAKDQEVAGTKVKPEELQPGDLLFYAHNKGKGQVHHVAMYIGEGRMIHSPQTGRTVEIIPVSTPEYSAEFAGARRFIPLKPKA
ncbi:C40 family peptidase [Paenibacillus sp. P26]|nr:C40 family peptidase [Paenibacillus sp. P26]